MQSLALHHWKNEGISGGCATGDSCPLSPHEAIVDRVVQGNLPIPSIHHGEALVGPAIREIKA